MCNVVKTKDKIIHQILNETSTGRKGNYSAETTETTADYTQASQSTPLNFTDTGGRTASHGTTHSITSSLHLVTMHQFF